MKDAINLRAVIKESCFVLEWWWIACGPSLDPWLSHAFTQRKWSIAWCNGSHVIHSLKDNGCCEQPTSRIVHQRFHLINCDIIHTKIKSAAMAKSQCGWPKRKEQSPWKMSGQGGHTNAGQPKQRWALCPIVLCLLTDRWFCSTCLDCGDLLMLSQYGNWLLWEMMHEATEYQFMAIGGGPEITLSPLLAIMRWYCKMLTIS